MNSVRSNNLSLKYLTPSGYKDIGITQFEFVAKTSNLLFVLFDETVNASKFKINLQTSK